MGLRTASAIFYIAVLIPTIPANAETTWHVDIANCPGPGSGSEADPFCKIQDGIDAAVDGDTVLIADGTYTGFRTRSGAGTVGDVHTQGISWSSTGGDCSCRQGTERRWPAGIRGGVHHRPGRSSCSIPVCSSITPGQNPH